jgi:methionyl-tRNA synthetase
LHPTRTLEEVTERNWFFRLSRYTEALKQLYATQPDFLAPAFRANEMLTLISHGLEDVSASRARFTWGVPFPRPLSTGETQTTYVWFDALPNYWTVTRGDAARAQWPAQAHIIGKDITRFHAIIWPAMLMSAGLQVGRREALARRSHRPVRSGRVPVLLAPRSAVRWRWQLLVGALR